MCYTVLRPALNLLVSQAQSSLGNRVRLLSQIKTKHPLGETRGYRGLGLGISIPSGWLGSGRTIFFLCRPLLRRVKFSAVFNSGYFIPLEGKKGLLGPSLGEAGGARASRSSMAGLLWLFSRAGQLSFSPAGNGPVVDSRELLLWVSSAPWVCLAPVLRSVCSVTSGLWGL